MKRAPAFTTSLLVCIPMALAACAPADPVPQPAGAGPVLPTELNAFRPADGAQVCPRPEVGVDLILTDATRKEGAFDPSTVTLTLDGADVTADAAIRTDLTFPASRLAILYTPAADMPLGQHTAALTYATSAGPATFTWHFTVINAPCLP